MTKNRSDLKLDDRIGKFKEMINQKQEYTIPFQFSIDIGLVNFL